MKNLIFLISLIALISFTLTSCDDDTTTVMDTPETMNLVQVAQEKGFTSLAAALTKAGLVDELQGNTNYTVFAPTNEAFSKLLETIGQKSIDDVPASVLEQILLYHVVSGNIKSSDITPGMVSTLEGTDIMMSTEGGIKINGVSVMNSYDIMATNGIIHTIDQVLVPSAVGQFVNSVLQPAYFSESFTTLISAAVKANVVETLLTTPNLTIFAPDNAAFEAAGIKPMDIDSETLASVLTYHVVGAKVMSTNIPRGAMTVNGNNLYFSIGASGNYINGNTMIKTVDIESGSGVVHVIDNVIMPPSGNIVDTAIKLSEGGEFTSLIAALMRTANEGTPEQNLVNVLMGDGPFTVFAPTNAAFQAVLDSNNEWTTLNDIPLNTLISVLTYHVVPARAYDKDLAGALDNNNELPTALGQNIKIDLSKFMINESSTIVGVNNNTTNGVIHVIDSVLLP